MSTSGDVYSYGILLLEMFTGKRPTDDTFDNGLNLCRYVEMGASAELVMEVVDPLMQFQDSHKAQLLTSLLQVGLSCANRSPRERMDMRDVARNIRTIRDNYLRLDINEQKE